MEKSIAPEVLGYQPQEEVQITKVRWRTLSDYDNLVFGQVYDSETADSRGIKKFVSHDGDEINSFKNFFDKKFLFKRGKVVWAEMGGGGAVAMRQLTSLSGMREKLVTFNVDLLDFEDRHLGAEALGEIARKSPRALRQENRPIWLKEDIQEVKLPLKADIITSVASIFYLNDPLSAMSNWYNQLDDQGVLIVAAEEKWSEWIRGNGFRPMDQFLKELQNLGIAVASNGSQSGLDENKGFNLVMMRKKPGSELKLKAEISEVKSNLIGRKESSYKKSDRMVEIVETG